MWHGVCMARSLTSSLNSPNFPQHLNTGLNSSFSPNQACLLFSLAGAVLHSVSALLVLMIQATHFKPKYQNYNKCRSLVSELFSSPLLFSSFTAPFAPFLALLGFQPLSPGLLLLSLAGIPYFVLSYTHKSPPLKALPASVSILLLSPACCSQKQKRKKLKPLRKSLGVGWHFRKQLQQRYSCVSQVQ